MWTRNDNNYKYVDNVIGNLNCNEFCQILCKAQISFILTGVKRRVVISTTDRCELFPVHKRAWTLRGTLMWNRLLNRLFFKSILLFVISISNAVFFCGFVLRLAQYFCDYMKPREKPILSFEVN